MRNKIANIITGSRILFSICLLFTPAFSAGFYILYLLCGISDMSDGAIARKTNTVSESGARSDTAADIIFAAVCFIKILPLIRLPAGLWIWVAVIAAVRIGNIVLGLILRKKFISLHTLMNKLTGFLLFLLPLTLPFIELKISAVALCLIATFSAIQEGVYIAEKRENK